CLFLQAEDGIRDRHVTGVQTCALPIFNLTSAMREDETEAKNYREKHGGHHPFPVVMHKRHGLAAPGKQWVSMTTEEFVRLLRVAGGVDTAPSGEERGCYHTRRTERSEHVRNINTPRGLGTLAGPPR